MNHSIMTNVVRHKYLYRLLDYSLKELSESFRSAYAFSRKACRSDMITLDWNLMYYSILNNGLRQIYLFKLFDHTWQEHK